MATRELERTATIEKPVQATDEEHQRVLVAALQSVIDVAGVSPAEAIDALIRLGEQIVPQARIVHGRVLAAGSEIAYERVRLRSLLAERNLRDAEGDGLSDQEFADMLGVVRETIRKYREKGLVFAWKKDTRSFRYPAWQIHQGQLLSGLGQVLAILREKWTITQNEDAFSILGYFLTPSTDLENQRPLDLLRMGKVEEVLADARRYGDIGT